MESLKRNIAIVCLIIAMVIGYIALIKYCEIDPLQEVLLPIMFVGSFFLAAFIYNTDPENAQHKVDIDAVFWYGLVWTIFTFAGVLLEYIWLINTESISALIYYSVLMAVQIATFALGYYTTCGILKLKSPKRGERYCLEFNYCKKSLDYIAGAFTILSMIAAITKLSPEYKYLANHIGMVECCVDVLLNIIWYFWEKRYKPKEVPSDGTACSNG